MSIWNVIQIYGLCIKYSSNSHSPCTPGPNRKYTGRVSYYRISTNTNIILSDSPSHKVGGVQQQSIVTERVRSGWGMNSRTKATATGVHSPDSQFIYHFSTLCSACGCLMMGYSLSNGWQRRMKPGHWCQMPSEYASESQKWKATWCSPTCV